MKVLELSVDRRSVSLPEEPEIRPVPNIEREGNSSKVYGTLTFRGVTVKERIPVHVLRWTDEEQAGYYRGVLLRLQRRLMTHLAMTLGQES